MIRSLLIAALVVLAQPVAIAQSAAEVEVVSDLFHEIEAEPGQSYTGEVLIKNPGDRPVDVRLSIQEYASRLGGVNSYVAPDGRPRSSAEWVSLPTTVVTLAPGEVRPVPFDIRVPDEGPGGDLRGTYWNALIVERAELAPPVANGDDQTVSIRTRVRYAVHIAVQLPGGLSEVRLLGAELVNGVEGRFLALDVENVGERVVRAEAWVELYRPDGAPLDRVDANRPLLYPGNQATLRVPLHAVPSGTYAGVLFIDGGADELIGQQLTLDLSAPVPETASAP